MFKTRKDCRICGHVLQNTIIDLGATYVSTFVDTNDTTAPRVPLELMQCEVCGLVQLHHTTDPDVMYSDYWYQSGLNASMVRALQDVVDSVHKRIELQPHDIVIDIGANDGTLLSMYSNDLLRVAFEPSNLAPLIQDKADFVLNTYFNRNEYYKRLGVNKARVITAIAMFYDLEDPHTFVYDLKQVLADDGIIVIQMMDLMSMIKTNDFPNICHEHLEYYSLETLTLLLGIHRLEIFDIEYNEVNGGSLRAYITHKNTRPVQSSVTKALAKEQVFFDTVGDLSLYFGKQIVEIKQKITTTIRDMTAANKSIAVLGASTKGNTILQYFDLTALDIIHAAEINKDKFGKRTIGTNIPIISEVESIALHPDAYLVLPWGFLPTFLQTFDTYLRSGGIFIVPLPKPIRIEYKGDELCYTSL